MDSMDIFVALSITSIVLVCIGLILVLKKFTNLSMVQIDLVTAIIPSFFLSVLLYFVLSKVGFTFGEAIITFLGMSICALVYLFSLRFLHSKLLSWRKNK
jgi:high-affinity Fe2+/Pb2+ permease